MAVQARFGEFLTPTTTITTTNLTRPLYTFRPDASCIIAWFREEHERGAFGTDAMDAQRFNSFVTELTRSLLVPPRPNTTTTTTTTTTSGDTVTALVRVRMARAWRFILLNEGRYPTRETAPELNMVQGAALVLKDRMVGAVARLRTLVDINLAVHAPFYNALLHDIAGLAVAAV